MDRSTSISALLNNAKSIEQNMRNPIQTFVLLDRQYTVKEVKDLFTCGTFFKHRENNTFWALSLNMPLEDVKEKYPSAFAKSYEQANMQALLANGNIEKTPNGVTVNFKRPMHHQEIKHLFKQDAAFFSDTFNPGCYYMALFSGKTILQVVAKYFESETNNIFEAFKGTPICNIELSGEEWVVKFNKPFGKQQKQAVIFNYKDLKSTAMRIQSAFNVAA